jgi:serine/threonine protein kinase/tetratricopeptide (TPR) repeat protein
MADKLLEEKAIFNRARQIAAPEERLAYLQETCGDHPAAMHRLLELLRVYEEQRSFLESSPVAHVTTIESPIAECPGTFIGPYKLLEQIGEGGFGVVFVAEQTEPVRRMVALKVLKPGMDTRQVVARFEAERQALAIMDHPNIAKVHDGGETASGRPYFVMELVKGVPITDYCDENQFRLRERLELFLHVCRAVQHAHQKGIIHRDIKPSNVLVASHDGVPLVKIIDFGVAKAVGQQLTERTLYTQFAQFIGTPLYMSPEQAGQSSVDVDTRSDIYSLGVLLYELLTGTTPFDRERLKTAGLDEIRRIIREEEPLKPSTRIRRDEGGKMKDEANRESRSGFWPFSSFILHPSSFQELDWIVMKALEKDRNRRYETASAFAADVRRYLADEPVLACSPSAGYRFGKFARRNKVALITASLVVASLFAGTAVATSQAVRATNAMAAAMVEKERADKQAATATSLSESLKQLLGSLSPDAAKGPDYTARQLLDDYANNLGSKLVDQPEVAADLHLILGRAYACLDQRAGAKLHLERALALCGGIFGDEHEKFADVLVAYSRPDTSTDWAQGEADLRRALAIYRKRGVGGEPVVYAIYVLQWMLAEQARAYAPAKWDEVEALLEEGLAEARKFPGQPFARIADLYSGCAGAKRARGRYAEAEAISREAIALGERLHGTDAYPVAWLYYGLADALRHQSRFREAIHADKRALAIMRKVLPPGHRCIAWALTAAQNTLDGADEAHALAHLFASVSELVDCESVFREVVATTKPTGLNVDDPVLAGITGLAQCGGLYLHLGDEWAAAGKSKEAEESRRRAVELWKGLQTQFAGNPRLLPYAYKCCAMALMKAGQPQQAKEFCRKLLELATPQTSGLCNNLAWFLATAERPAQRDPALAVELAKRAVDADARSGPNHNALGVAYYRSGEYRQSIRELQESVEISQGGTSYDFFFLAMDHWQLGDKDQARSWFRKAVEWMDKHEPRDEDLLRFRAEAAELLGVK